MYDVIYREARQRITAIARTLDDEQLGRAVAACPEWTVRALIAHLSGVAHDAATGRLDGAPGTEWTERHVGERLNRPVEQNLAEWEGFSEKLEQGLRSRKAQLQLVHDITQHEADLRTALGLERLPEKAWRPMLEHIGGAVGHYHEQPWALVVRSDGSEWRIGDGEPAATVEAEPFELWRGFFGRRSAEQMRAWAWDRTPEAEHLDAVLVFPARSDALVEN
ncbi:maleylpyruvate isomerase family mycothiol-dependent enzyme [Allokutzneria sp. NRRL B-24872]|uniref:maleylpyruvate isomerase family mycothiol-dependent enzyme n=1 Tax=Allokutzneria sp. NRRL B-24872 TaxID=1137961 RepID=UPI000A3B1F43|nr:maleylpyruvate isomerase family mycothiol-dependent enzyme [Allokutzneria sp. NRRL B-24872]